MHVSVFHSASRQTSELLLLGWKVQHPATIAIRRNFVNSFGPRQAASAETRGECNVHECAQFAAQATTQKEQ